MRNLLKMIHHPLTTYLASLYINVMNFKGRYDHDLRDLQIVKEHTDQVFHLLIMIIGKKIM